MNATCFLFKCGYKKITAMYTSPIILLLVSVRWALRPEAASLTECLSRCSLSVGGSSNVSPLTMEGGKSALYHHTTTPVHTCLVPHPPKKLKHHPVRSISSTGSIGTVCNVIPRWALWQGMIPFPFLQNFVVAVFNVLITDWDSSLPRIV